MSYDPQDHIPSARQIIAAWVVCLGIAGLALGMTAGRQEFVPEAAADPVHVAGAPDPCPMAGVRIPTLAVCQADQAGRATSLAHRDRGAMSLPASKC
jgi:hypothetical protein